MRIQNLRLLRLASVAIISAIALIADKDASAQIVPDNTLGRENSRVTPNVRVRGGRADRIDGGAVRTGNLFHSFEAFNVEALQRVYFTNPTGIENILTRVTGDDVSDIFGTLGVDGNANLFLLNPNGIVFGESAQLDIRGSFVATTADAFEFADGSTFSAVNPEAPPLLTMNVTPGLQYGTAATPRDTSSLDNTGTIVNAGNLAVGETLMFAADHLNLTGQLRAGRHLNLRSRETVQIRDGVTTPFVAEAGRNLRIRGRDLVEIAALSHPASELRAGRNLMLRSDSPIVGDARFLAGREFRIERLNGRLGNLISPDDPVIRSSGDVSFRNYAGASLHIFAGGSVTIPGEIVITGADTLENSIRERVVLSDRETVVEIDGSAEPTLDIRAGMRSAGTVGVTGDGIPNDLELGTTARRANITIGNIRNEGGTVFLTNQYRPNLALGGGNIRTGEINTAVERSTARRARGGNVFIDARRDIEIREDISTFAHVRTVDEFGNTVSSDGNNTQAFGGNVTLFSEQNISAQSFDTSAIAIAELEQQTGSQLDEVNTAQSRNIRAVARGGVVTLATRVDTGQQPVRSSVGNIEINDISTYSHTEADGLDQQGQSIARGGTIESSISVGGDVFLSTQVLTGTIADTSDVATIQADNINSSARASADASAYAENSGSGGEAIAGSIRRTRSQGGIVALSTQINASDISNASDLATIRTNTIDSSAYADAMAFASAFDRALVLDGEKIARAGTIENISSQSGVVSLSASVGATNIEAAFDIASLRICNNCDKNILISEDILAAIDTSTLASTNASARANATDGANNRANGGEAVAGSIQGFRNWGGDVFLSAEVETGNISNTSDIAAIRVGSTDVDSINSSVDAQAIAFSTAYTNALSDNSNNAGDAGEAIAGSIEGVRNRSGAITATTRVNAGVLEDTSDLATIQAETINSSVDTDARASARATTDADAINSGNAGRASAGSIENVRTQGGSTTLVTYVDAGHISNSSDVATIQTNLINSSAIAYSAASTNASANDFARADENDGSGGEATAGSVERFSSQGGAVSLSTQIVAGDITTTSDTSDNGTLRANIIDSSADAVSYTTAGATSSQNSDGSGSARGGIAESSARGGRILLSTEIDSGAVDSASDSGMIQFRINSLISSDARSSADARARDQEVTFGRVVSSANGGNIDFRADGQILMGSGSELNASAGTFSRVVSTINVQDNITFSGGNISFISANSIVLNQISAATNAEFIINNDVNRILNILASSAGNLIVQSPNIIRLRQNASVSVEATGQEGTAGDVAFASRFLVLGDNSRLTSETESGNGGNISLGLQDALLLQNGSRISTSAGTIGNGGDGGNINLTLSNGYILAETWNSNTDITANAFNGSGGQITITTPGLFQLIQTRPIITEQLLRNSDPGNDFTTFIDGIFGLIPRSRSDLEDLLGTTNPAELDPANLPSNDITAISQNNPNLSGEIIFQTPDLDPSQGTIELPSNFIDPLVTPTCEAQPRTESEYSITGQGGIPSSPDNPLTRDTLLDDLGPPSLVQDSAAPSADSEDIALPDGDRPIEIIEAQGLSIDADGNLALVADASNSTPQNDLHHHPNCTENLTSRSVSNL